MGVAFIFFFVVFSHLRLGLFWRVVSWVVLGFWLVTLLQVVYCKFFPPIATPLMVRRYLQQRKRGRGCVRFEWKFVPIEAISPYMVDAADVAENMGLFLYSRGFLFRSLCWAYRRNLTSRQLRGGSIIVQQTAKNCFLPHCRTLLRKLVEAHYVVLMEIVWGKRRIMECYLNVVEWGDGIYGCEAASQHYFHHSAATLTRTEAVMLAAALPWPLRANPNCHTRYYDERIVTIHAYLRDHEPIDWGARYEDMDPQRLAEGNRGLLFFVKWWCLRVYRRLVGTGRGSERVAVPCRRERSGTRRCIRPWHRLGFGGKAWRVLWMTAVTLWLVSALQVVLCKFVMPPFTPHMVGSYMGQRADSGRTVRFERVCVPIDDVSPNLINAVLIAEDWLFLYHRGFLFSSLRDAYMDYRRGGATHGGSTISQQTAKNCFLPFDRTLLRKAVEAHYTFLIEMIWGKRRIMECYLNVAEWGDGIYGCEAACRHYFHHSSKTVSIEEAELLAAMLAAPLKADPYHRTPRYEARIAMIDRHIGEYAPLTWKQRCQNPDPDKVARGSRGFFYFVKWLILHKLRIENYLVRQQSPLERGTAKRGRYVPLTSNP